MDIIPLQITNATMNPYFKATLIQGPYCMMHVTCIVPELAGPIWVDRILEYWTEPTRLANLQMQCDRMSCTGPAKISRAWRVIEQPDMKDGIDSAGALLVQLDATPPFTNWERPANRLCQTYNTIYARHVVQYAARAGTGEIRHRLSTAEHIGSQDRKRF